MHHTEGPVLDSIVCITAHNLQGIIRDRECAIFASHRLCFDLPRRASLQGCDDVA
jgi:hypothetical protein